MVALLPLALLVACSQEPAHPPPATTATTATTAAPSPEPAGPTAVRPEEVDRLLPSPPQRLRPSAFLTQPDEATTRAIELLSAVVGTWGSDPGNAWAIGHALMALGPDLKLSDGTNAVDGLFALYAEEGQLGGHTLVEFPESRGEIRVEPHTDLLLKVLTEIGVEPERVVLVNGHPHPVADLWRASLLQSYLVAESNHSSYASPNDMPWSLQGLSAWAPPELRWVAIDGTPMSMDLLTNFNAAILQKETQFLAEAAASGADFERKGQGIFNYTCGGAHLLTGTGYAVARGFGSQRTAQVLKEQVDLNFYRFPRELRINDQAVQAWPEHKRKLMVQRLKYTGHFLEGMHTLAAIGVYRPTPEQQKVLTGARQQVLLVASAIQKEGIYADLPTIREDDLQFYLDVVGDSAHALHGLLLASGQAEVRF